VALQEAAETCAATTRRPLINRAHPEPVPDNSFK
jgi:hypothetical protein